MNLNFMISDCVCVFLSDVMMNNDVWRSGWFV